jgi:segregation and condensation protein A
MSLPALWQASSNYKITTDVYEGPLDLLLQLVEQAELDITKISLAKVTNHYLHHIRALSTKDPIEVSAFLVIAAKLVLLKSSILLPSGDKSDIEEEENPADQLVRQLILYKQFKEKSLWLKNRQEKGLRSYIRVSTPLRINEKLDLSGINIYDIVDILLNIYFQNENTTPMSDVVTITTLTIKNKINQIISLFQKQPQRSFSEFLDGENSRITLVITFLALLELIKNYSVHAQQEELFGDIIFVSGEVLESDFEPEF